MKNVEKLKQIGILGDIRQRLGADSAKDDTYDEEINLLDSHEILKQYSAWILGDKHWWSELKSVFDRLENLK